MREQYSSIIFWATVACCLAICFQVAGIENAEAQTTGSYRTVASGNWNQTAVWEKYNGTTWAPAIATPASTDASIEIHSGHTVTVTAGVTVDEVTIDSGSFLTINSGYNFILANGAGTDLVVNGTMTINGTLTQNSLTAIEVTGNMVASSGCTHSLNAGATTTILSGGRYRNDGGMLTTTAGHWIINSGGTYQSNANGEAIPYSTWNSGATCEITGITTIKPNNMDQAFYHFKWNCLSQTVKADFANRLTTINGDFTVVSTGTGSIRLTGSGIGSTSIGGNYNHQGGTLKICNQFSWSLSVAGNYNQTGGTFNMIDSIDVNSIGTPTMNVTGNFILSGGTYNLSNYSGSTAAQGIGTLNIGGNYTQTGGSVIETAATGVNYGYGIIYFNKTGTQVFSKTGGTISNTIHFTVNSGSILDVGTSVISGGGNFSLLGGGGFVVSDANGIGLSGASGNVQVSGTRSYNSGADYTFAGSAAQITGNGLPATVHNLTINNSAGVTLTNSTAVSNVLTFSGGNLVTSNDTLTLGTGTAVLGTLSRTSGHVIGYFRRWIDAVIAANILFPVGTSTDYKGASYSYTVAPASGGTLTVNFNAGNPGTLGFNLYDAPDSIQTIGNGYWNSNPANGLTGGTFSVDLTATNLFGVTNYSALHLLRRTNAASPWTLAGTHVSATGSNTVPVLHRSGMSSSGQFGIGSPSGGAGNILPFELVNLYGNFNGDCVHLYWRTAIEINSDYFTIERSRDKINFNELQRLPGAGNASTFHEYVASDAHPFPGKSYYRLKQTDYDGHVTYLGIVSIEAKNEKASFKIYPNPNNGLFIVSYPGNQRESVNLQIKNMFGNIVYSESSVSGEKMIEKKLDMSAVPNGFYLVQITDENGRQLNEGLIINH